ncbi:MAG: hypothetical protein LBD96_05655 [Treponema sp.]|jgi:hypothetical protein|nr:hypothetical protein [Treponema sp.]
MWKKAIVFFFILFSCFSFFLFSQENSVNSSQVPLRSLDGIFPSLDGEIKQRVFSTSGYFASYEKNYHTLDASDLDPRIRSEIDNLKPSVVIEYLLVVPYPSRPMKPVDIYNAIRHIRALNGRLYHSETRGEDVPLFEDATRIAGARRTSILDDPPPRDNLPDSETIHIRLKDANFGNSYYQANIYKNVRGFSYNLSNSRDLSYIIFPVIKSGQFIAQFYFEPLTEGILVYCLSGAKVSDFLASRVDIPSAIQKRLDVILGWVIDCVSGRL